jgi:hypothetical protein
MDFLKKSALQRLTSPDQINRRLKVITFKGWIAIATVGVIVFSILFWSVIGRIPTNVQGRAIVFDPDRSLSIRAEIPGAIEEIYVKVGDTVEKGAKLASLKNSQLATESIERQIVIDSLQKFLELNTDLNASEKTEIEKEILLAKARLEAIQISLQNETVLAPQKGNVVDINTPVNGSVEEGTALLWLEVPRNQEKQKIFAVFPRQAGELIQEKMSVQLTFNSVNSQKYGQLFGTVTKVFPYFSSLDQGPLRRLPSDELRTYLEQGEIGAVIVAIEPITDPSTPTGYKWSTLEGPPFALPEGSIGTAKVVTEVKRPISYLIPEKSR